MPEKMLCPAILKSFVKLMTAAGKRKVDTQVHSSSCLPAREGPVINLVFPVLLSALIVDGFILQPECKIWQPKRKGLGYKEEQVLQLVHISFPFYAPLLRECWECISLLKNSWSSRSADLGCCTLHWSGILFKLLSALQYLLEKLKCFVALFLSLEPFHVWCH